MQHPYRTIVFAEANRDYLFDEVSDQLICSAPKFASVQDKLKRSTPGIGPNQTA